MKRQLVRIGNRVALELEESELEKLGVGEETDVEVSVDAGVMVVVAVGSEATEEAFELAARKVNKRYVELFRRLSK